jgi:hypothetical protein
MVPTPDRAEERRQIRLLEVALGVLGNRRHAAAGTPRRRAMRPWSPWLLRRWTSVAWDSSRGVGRRETGRPPWTPCSVRAPVHAAAQPAPVRRTSAPAVERRSRLARPHPRRELLLLPSSSDAREGIAANLENARRSSRGCAMMLQAETAADRRRLAGCERGKTIPVVNRRLKKSSPSHLGR